jgi:hypothetical protein
MYEKPTSMNRNLSTEVSGKNPRVYIVEKNPPRKRRKTGQREERKEYISEGKKITLSWQQTAVVDSAEDRWDMILPILSSLTGRSRS